VIVRSILLGPEIEWSTEQAADLLEIRIYPDADGDFILYEEKGESYDYEKGVYATIGSHWMRKHGH
jgi:alpha-D-xyloside xylohydrolase